MSERSDGDLIEACLAGEPSAWESLVHRYRRLVYSVPVKLGLKSEDCDEVFQQTAIALLEKLATLRDRDRIGLWLAVTARRKAIDLVSRGSAARETELKEGVDVESDSPLPLDHLVALEQAASVRAALETVGERCRKLLEALYFADPTPPYRVIARELGVAIGSLGPTRARCFSKLKVALGGTCITPAARGVSWGGGRNDGDE